MSTALLRGHRWGDDTAPNGELTLAVPVGHKPDYDLRGGLSLEADDDLLALAWAGLIASRCGIIPNGWGYDEGWIPRGSNEARWEELTGPNGEVLTVTCPTTHEAEMQGRLEAVEAIAWHGAMVLRAANAVTKEWSA